MAETTYTKPQMQVIEHDGGHAVVAAVAGSGKTETLVGRVRHLLRFHAPKDIAVVMFNRDARIGFEERCKRAIGSSPPEIRTFNSMGNKIVAHLVQHGLLPEAEIREKDFFRTKLARKALTHVFKKLHGEEQSPDKDLIEGFVSFLLLVKSDVLEAEDVFEQGRYGRPAAAYPEAFQVYEQLRQREKVRFFEDQIYDPVKLMLKNPDTQRHVTNRVDHLIVDEAQDVNGIQIALLRILAGTRGKVMLVGDEDQAIYEWRGAKPDYLTRGFEKDFNSATRYTLPHTFRFGHVLSLAASQLITRNANRNLKISISAEGTPRTRIHCVSLGLGSTGLGDRLHKVLANGRSPSEVAVLVRTYSLSVALELELHQLGIPYFVHGRPPLIRIPEISALVGVLQLASGRWRNLEPNELGFVIRNLLQRPTLYLDKVAVDRVVEQVAFDQASLPVAIRGLISPQTKLFQADQIRNRADLLDIIATDTAPEKKAVDVIDRYLLGTDFERLVEKQSATGEVSEAVLANVAAFKLIASRHSGTIGEFLDDIDPLIDSSKVDPPHVPHVWIGSIHRAKGAQWPVVFVPGLSGNTFPTPALDSQEIESERRLFYVAVTRATDELYLAHPSDPELVKALSNISTVGQDRTASPVSRFVWEMDLGLARHAALAIESGGPFHSAIVDRPNVANEYFQHFPVSAAWSYSPQPKVHRVGTDVAPAERIVTGTRVRHHTFGPGRVDRWVDKGVVRVIFDTGDTRMLLASTARLAPE